MKLYLSTPSMSLAAFFVELPPNSAPRDPIPTPPSEMRNGPLEKNLSSQPAPLSHEKAAFRILHLDGIRLVLSMSRLRNLNPFA